jgi:hypothetical protein
LGPARDIVLRSVLAAAAFVAAGPASAVEVAAPLPWQEPGAVGRMFLQLPFEEPEVLPPGRVAVGLQLLYTNDFIGDASSTLAVTIDFESAALTPSVRYAIARGVELQAALPVYVNYGGFLDGWIENVEAFFQATSPGRLSTPRNLSVFRLVRPDGAGFDVQGTQAGLGDAWAAVKAAVLDADAAGLALSLRGAMKFPTGAPGFGSGTVDFGFGGLLGWTGGPVGLRLQVDGYLPTGSLQSVGLGTRVYGAAQLGAAFQVSEVVALHAQTSAHLSPVWSDVKFISYWTFYVLLGATFRVGPAGAVQVGVTENIFTPTRGADFTVLVNGRVSL